MNIFGKDYIKFLNDERTGFLTYDQWKNKNSHLAAKKQISSDNGKAAKHTEGYKSTSLFHKND